jgi:hypothetical protein
VKQTYYTPKEYEAAFQEPWGGRDAVYFVDYTDTDEGETDQRFWSVGTLGEIKKIVNDINNGDVLCATTHCPPIDYIHQMKGKNQADEDKNMGDLTYLPVVSTSEKGESQ